MAELRGRLGIGSNRIQKVNSITILHKMSKLEGGATGIEMDNSHTTVTENPANYPSAVLVDDISVQEEKEEQDMDVVVDLKSIQQQVVGSLEQATKALSILSSDQFDSSEFLKHAALFTETLVTVRNRLMQQINNLSNNVPFERSVYGHEKNLELALWRGDIVTYGLQGMLQRVDKAIVLGEEGIRQQKRLGNNNAESQRV